MGPDDFDDWTLVVAGALALLTYIGAGIWRGSGKKVPSLAWLGPLALVTTLAFFFSGEVAQVGVEAVHAAQPDERQRILAWNTARLLNANSLGYILIIALAVFGTASAGIGSTVAGRRVSEPTRQGVWGILIAYVVLNVAGLLAGLDGIYLIQSVVWVVAVAGILALASQRPPADQSQFVVDRLNVVVFLMALTGAAGGLVREIGLIEAFESLELTRPENRQRVFFAGADEATSRAFRRWLVDGIFTSTAAAVLLWPLRKTLTRASLRTGATVALVACPAILVGVWAFAQRLELWTWFHRMLSHFAK